MKCKWPDCKKDAWVFNRHGIHIQLCVKHAEIVVKELRNWKEYDE
jgi:hypothetical protein